MKSNFEEYIKNTVVEKGLLEYYDDFTGDLEISITDFSNNVVFTKAMSLINLGRKEIEGVSYIWVLSREEDIYIISLISYDSAFLER